MFVKQGGRRGRENRSKTTGRKNEIYLPGTVAMAANICIAVPSSIIPCCMSTRQASNPCRASASAVKEDPIPIQAVTAGCLAFHKSRTRLVRRREAMLGLGGGLEGDEMVVREVGRGVCALSCWGGEGEGQGCKHSAETGRRSFSR